MRMEGTPNPCRDNTRALARAVLHIRDMTTPRMTEADVVRSLERVSDLLTVQGAQPRRVDAYRRAARVVLSLGGSLVPLWREGGLSALEALPGMLPATALATEELLHTGRLGLLERLEGEVSPIEVFASIPGVGEKLAHEFHDLLGVDTLEELEKAAHDGRIEGLPGIGPRRAAAIRDALEAILSRSTRRRLRRSAPDNQQSSTSPSIELLLALDDRYRTLARQGRLQRVAPQRFNPDRKAWLPVMHVDVADRHFHILYSNTARAHRLGKTRDWVLVFHEDHGHEDQCTVVTEYEGALKGKRVVRGREDECVEHYRGLGERSQDTLETLALQ